MAPLTTGTTGSLIRVSRDPVGRNSPRDGDAFLSERGGSVDGMNCPIPAEEEGW